MAAIRLPAEFDACRRRWPTAALRAGAGAMIARQLQWIAVAAVGCVGLGDVSGDEARVVAPDAANLMRLEWHFTLPRAEETGRLLSPRSLKQSRSGCQTGEDDNGDVSTCRRLRWARRGRIDPGSTFASLTDASAVLPVP